MICSVTKLLPRPRTRALGTRSALPLRKHVVCAQLVNATLHGLISRWRSLDAKRAEGLFGCGAQ
jgi:hypothetical protein